MRTLDEQNARAYGVRARLQRDAKLLWRLARLTFSYFTEGASIRRRYREMERRGEIYFVD